MEIAAALSGLRGLIDTAKIALEARDDAKVKEALAGMSERLLNAYGVALETAEKNAQLQATIQALNQKHVELERQLTEKEMCRLVPLGKNSFAYLPAGQLQEGSDRTLYYCQPCYDKGVKSVLRYSPADSYGYARWICVEHGGHNISG